MVHFYNATTRKYVVAFANLFGDVHVIRQDDIGNTINDLKVPIVYAAKSKLFYVPDNLGLDGEANISHILPRMGFYISGMSYDSFRKLNSNFEINLGGGKSLPYAGVPYNFTIELAIVAKFQDDLFQIVEQLASKFTPDVVMRVKEIPEFGVERDVSINLDAVNFTSVNEYGDIEQRIVSAELSFTLRGWLYPAAEDITGEIYNIYTNYINMNHVTSSTIVYDAILNVTPTTYLAVGNTITLADGVGVISQVVGGTVYVNTDTGTLLNLHGVAATIVTPTTSDAITISNSFTDSTLMIVSQIGDPDTQNIIKTITEI